MPLSASVRTSDMPICLGFGRPGDVPPSKRSDISVLGADHDAREYWTGPCLPLWVPSCSFLPLAATVAASRARQHAARIPFRRWSSEAVDLSAIGLRCCSGRTEVRRGVSLQPLDHLQCSQGLRRGERNTGAAQHGLRSAGRTPAKPAEPRSRPCRCDTSPASRSRQRTCAWLPSRRTRLIVPAILLFLLKADSQRPRAGSLHSPKS